MIQSSDLWPGDGFWRAEVATHPQVMPAMASVEAIVDTVTSAYHIPKRSLWWPERTQHLAMARHVAMYLCRVMVLERNRASRRLAPMSFPRIGEFFDRDHSSTIHACQQVQKRIEREPGFAHQISQLIAVIEKKA